MQSHPLESSESLTTIPDSQTTLQSQTTEDKQDNSHLSHSLTLLIGLADVEEKEEQEKKTKLPQAPKKAEPSFSRDSTNLLIAPMRLMRHFQSEVLVRDPTQDVFADHLRTL